VAYIKAPPWNPVPVKVTTPPVPVKGLGDTEVNTGALGVPPPEPPLPLPPDPLPPPELLELMGTVIELLYPDPGFFTLNVADATCGRYTVAVTAFEVTVLALV
jgi:hypothetical protein